MSKEFQGLAGWLLKSTYFEDVRNWALHAESQRGISMSSVYTQSAQRNFTAPIPLT